MGAFGALRDLRPTVARIRSVARERARRPGDGRTLHSHLIVGFGIILALLAALTVVAALFTQGMEQQIVLACGTCAIVAGVLAANWSTRRTTGPIRAALAAAQRITAGDLTSAVEVGAGGEIGALMHALAQMQARMFQIVSEVRTGTTTVAGTSSQITRDNESLSERTQGQAASVQQTVSSMEQITSTVHRNAQDAQQANALVVTASQQAIRGGAAMAEVVDTMGAIKGSSRKIGDIISVVDAIAFQTNLLALNAAVEAARAGEQGRGFAVVAGEVRTLSRRVADAAGEIKALIGESVKNVELGGRLVDDAGRTIGEVVASVKQVEDIMGRINTASQQQSSGIESINAAVAKIDRMTRRNSALVEDVRKTATSLNEQSVALMRTVTGFDLGEREFGNADEAVALVQGACAFLASHGKDALLADINRLGKGRFVDRDLYLMVIGAADAVFVAHGNNPRVLGLGPKSTDVDGRLFVQEMAQAARVRGEGWIDYKWAHPVTNEIRTKTSFFKRAGDIVIACGIYKA
ncbi:MAG TPA: methyl-accepting chemotaxis protein [Rudaea sp.]|nr:methyl-accepting chemotaxis protein [Rudaea sp.]